MSAIKAISNLCCWPTRCYCGQEGGYHYAVVLHKRQINQRVPRMQVFAPFAVYCLLGTKCCLQVASKSFMAVGGSRVVLKGHRTVWPRGV